MRGEIITALADRIREQVTDFRLVKAYEGEAVRSRDSDGFIAAVRGVFPCCLCMVDSIADHKSQNKSLRLEINVSCLIACTNFTGENGVPDIYGILDKTLSEVHCFSPEIPGATDFRFVSDGHVAHNEFFVMYEQKYTIMYAMR